MYMQIHILQVHVQCIRTLILYTYVGWEGTHYHDARKAYIPLLTSHMMAVLSTDPVARKQELADQHTS